MFSSQPFRVLISALIMLGLHVCCCQLKSLGMLHAGDLQVQAAGCCHAAEHGDDSSEGPSTPQDVPHDGCETHARAVTIESRSVELPELSLGTLVPFGLGLALATDGSWRMGTVRAMLAAPSPETSLLKRHCALII